MSERKGIGGARQFKQTKLTFGSASQRPSTQSSSVQLPKRQKLSNKDVDDNGISSKPKGVATKGVAETNPIEGNKSPNNAVSEVVSHNPEDVSDALEHQQSSSTNPEAQGTHLRIAERVGDLFDAPRRSVLIHACNATGSWGGGIALAFRQHYPDAYKIYNAHCKRSIPQRLVGTALLIAPRDGTRREHYVGCLFTSKRFGRNKDSPEDILRATEPAIRDLIQQILREMASGEDIGEVRICHVNSGLFAVPWHKSKSLIESIQLRDGGFPEASSTFSREIIAYSPN